MGVETWFPFRSGSMVNKTAQSWMGEQLVSGSFYAIYKLCNFGDIIESLLL